MEANQELNSGGFSRGRILGAAWLLMIGMTIVGVTGYLRLGSDTSALRSSLQQSVGGEWNKKVAVHVGPFTLALARFGLRFVPQLPAEAQAAAQALHGAEVGVYQVKGDRNPDPSRVLTEADRIMTKRGWERAVGVAKEGELVGVYVPHKKMSARTARCCVMVLHDSTAVVVGARGDIRPLMALATNRLDTALESSPLALR